MKSENKNFILNALYQILLYIFPLITVSYVSRILGVDNVGIYSYTYSIVYVFMLFGMLGINNYGNRAVAKVRDDKEKLSKEFCSIYQLQIMVSVFVLIAYIIYLIFFCKQYRVVAIIQIVQLISVFFDVTWFYFGLEKFKLTILRNIIIKVCSMGLIFLFVKDRFDLNVYTVIMAGSTLVSQLYLVSNLHKYIIRIKCNLIESLKHLKTILILFVPVLAFCIYRVMDKTMIGAFASVTELGYYENAERLINIPISVINALGTVMLPRMTYLFCNEICDYKKTILESMKLALLISIGMSAGLILISQDIVIILFGSEFSKSGEIIKILSITVLASAWANVIRTQYLIPKSLDKIYVRSTVGGAFVNLVLNLLLIRKYGSYGACLGTIVAEFFVAIYQTIKVRKEIEVRKYIYFLVSYMLKTLCIMGGAYLAGLLFRNIYMKLLVNVVVFIFIFIILNFKYLMYDFFGIQKNV